MENKSFFIGFKEGQKAFGESIGAIVNSILLSLVYFVPLGITSILSRISKKEFLEMNVSSEVESYWKDMESKDKTMEDYYKQF